MPKPHEKRIVKLANLFKYRSIESGDKLLERKAFSTDVTSESCGIRTDYYRGIQVAFIPNVHEVEVVVFQG